MRPDSDPLRRLMDLAAMARSCSEKHPDFAERYKEVARKCDHLCCALLGHCKTTHEVRGAIPEICQLFQKRSRI